MKVGIDVRLLSRSLTGMGRYTLEMCRALAKIPAITLYLYSPGSIGTVVKGLEGTVIKTKGCNSAILRQFWSETILPFWVKNDKVDVFWGPTHRLPRYLPKQTARVVTIHDLVWKYAGNSMRSFSRLLERYQMPHAIRVANRIVTVSKATAQSTIQEFNIDPGKVSVIPLAAAFIRQDTKDISSICKYIDNPYILFVGTLEPRKNLFRLLSAYSKLPQSIKNRVSLVIAGGKGWGNINTNKVIEKLGLQKTVKVLGYVNESTLSALYANCLFLAMPSLYEGFGLPIIEAMHFGKAVLTSNTSSMPEVAGNAGFLVDPLNIDSIYNGLQKMINNNSLRNKYAAQAKNNVARFNWDTSANKLVDIFQQAIIDRKCQKL